MATLRQGYERSNRCVTDNTLNRKIKFLCQRKHFSLPILILILYLAINNFPAIACGGYFPNQFLFRSEKNVLSAPETNFETGFQELLVRLDYQSDLTYIPSQTPILAASITDRDELELALQGTDVYESLQGGIYGRFLEVRTVLDRYSQEFKNRGCRNNPEAIRSWIDNLKRHGWQDFPPIDEVVIPVGLPLDYAYYIRGALNYYRGDWIQAQSWWEQLLKLPEENRRNRSTWASYMLGKTMMYDSPTEAAGWFQMTRHLEADGFADSLGLAASSLVYEAGIEARRGNYARAMELFVDAYIAGDTSVIINLKRTIYDLFGESPEIISQVAEDPILRQIVNLFVSSHCGETNRSYSRTISFDDLELWIDSLEAAGVTEIENAEHVAWAAYRAGRMVEAVEWLERGTDTNLAVWLRAKLAVRAGDIESAVEYLERAANIFPDDEIWATSSVRANFEDRTYSEIIEYDPGMMSHLVVPNSQIACELGTLYLGHTRYEEAMNLFLSAGKTSDAAYIGERLLSPEEFKAYVDRYWPAPDQEVPYPEYRYQMLPFLLEDRDNIAKSVRHILARRLARLERWEEARDYFPIEVSSGLDVIVEGITAGNDTSLNNSERADGYWQAAGQIRESGWSIFGYSSSSPTSLYYHYSYRWDANGSEETYENRLEPSETTLLPASEDELERVELFANEIEESGSTSSQFNVSGWYRIYRYIACDMAWKAVELMPDGDYETALRLCTAGGWIKSRDPIGADIFYKALVNRCISTELGWAADERRWFPDCDSYEYDPDHQIAVIYYWD